MTELVPPSDLTVSVNTILELLQGEASLRTQQDTTAIETSLKKALSPKFEIVFAGAFSAGKSMLINAILERELLYSAEGHATGTECYIEYAPADGERVVLTFLSEAEIRALVETLCQRLELPKNIDIASPEHANTLNQCCQKIIESEGGEAKSDRAKQARGLQLLIEGFQSNRERIHPVSNATYSMEQFNFTNLADAAGFARRGSNSAVLKLIEYHCHHPLLKDGNVLVDMPGIDAPVKKDAELAYRKIEHPDTSAVIAVLKAAAAGELATEETELLEKMRSNPGIRDRVFYVFNRIDETWYNSQLDQRLKALINSQFRDTTRLYPTSGLLGFYGARVKNYTHVGDRFGLDSLFAQSVKGLGGEEETPQFVSEFNNYCANSGKLLRTPFKVSIHGYETPNENYVRVLGEWGNPLLDQLIADSGIEQFRGAITRYLTEEKRPQLFATLADDLQPLCITLKNHYQSLYRHLESQPREIEVMKAQELTLLNQELQDLGKAFTRHIAEEVDNIIVNTDAMFETDFKKLKARMVARLDELLTTFSVGNAYHRAVRTHPRNSTAPLLAILVEALYYLSNELEDVLVEESMMLINRFCQRLIDRVRQSEYYRHLYRLLGNDGGIEYQIQQIEELLRQALVSAARGECDRYVRESPQFYNEGTFSIYQFRQTLQQTSQGYDCENMTQAEPAIRQLLKLDFEPKVLNTIQKNFRQTINNTLKTLLLPMATKQADMILQQYDKARAYLEQTLEQEAEEKIASNAYKQNEIRKKIEQYNQAINRVNSCLTGMNLQKHHLPAINAGELVIAIEDTHHTDGDL
jgi:replication fork clamp-binding protein CrfC